MHTVTRIDKTLVPSVIWQDESLDEIIQEFNTFAHHMGFIWKSDKNMLFGGYWVNPANGDGFLIDYPLEQP